MCRLLNSTPQGEVTSERQLYRDPMRAGYRIADGTLNSPPLDQAHLAIAAGRR